MGDDIKSGISMAIVILALCLGIGSCSYLKSIGQIKVINAEQQIYKINK